MPAVWNRKTGQRKVPRRNRNEGPVSFASLIVESREMVVDAVEISGSVYAAALASQRTVTIAA